MRNVFATTKNVKRFLVAWDQLNGRCGCLLVYGIEGTGKTRTMVWAKVRFGGEDRPIPYVRATRVTTPKGLLEEIVSELGEAPAWKTCDILTQAVRILRERPRPVIIDEIDFLFRDGVVEVLRDIHDLSNAPIILCGMAQAEKKLMRLPHFYDRLISVVQFQLLDKEDVRELANQVCEVRLDESAIGLIQEKSNGKLRRITTSFYKAERIAKASGLKEVTAAHLSKGD